MGVVRGLGLVERRGAQGLAGGFVEIRRRGALDDFLVAPLHGAVALVFVRIDRHGAYTQFRGGVQYPDGDLAAVGNEEATDFLHGCFY